MKTDNTIAQAHDEAYEFMTSLAVNKDFDTDLSLDEFYHKYTLDMSSYSAGDVIFIKIYVQDDVNDVTEIPSNGTEYQIIKHFTFTVQ
mgnify:CR=1 FL=1